MNNDEAWDIIHDLRKKELKYDIIAQKVESKENNKK